MYKEKMWDYILCCYPKAEFEFYFETPSGGPELQFLPHPNADAPYACILRANHSFQILEEF